MTTDKHADEKNPSDFPEQLLEDSIEVLAAEVLEDKLSKNVQAELDQQAAADLVESVKEGDVEEGAESVDEDGPPTYEELKSEVAALKDQLLRALAEGQNVRRRIERDKADMSKYAITNFARQIISVADNLTRALASVSETSRKKSEELNSLFIGIEMTDKELLNSFEQFNIKLVESVGQKFDHNIHQAMFEVDDPNQVSGMVVQEMQKGYLLHDRLLRPAMVGVSKGGPKPEVGEEAVPVVKLSVEKTANESSSAYEKQADVADQAAEGGDMHLDRKL
jgi:molecular chaperone GrpE